MKRKKLIQRVLSIVLVVVMAVTGLNLPEGGLVLAASESNLVDYQSMKWKDLYALDENLTWVFTGDSITHVADYTAGMNGYPEYVEQRLIEMGRKDDAVINSAWGGITMYEMLNDTENFILKYNPDVVFIKLGMNDRAKTTYGTNYANRVELFKDYYQTVVEKVIASGKENGKIPKIVLVSSAPRSSDNLLNKEQFDEDTCWPFALATERVAKENGLHYIDFMTAFAEEAKVLGDDYAYLFFSDDSDGATHPNQAAHHFMFEVISKEIGLYDETSPLYQLEYLDFIDYALYPDVEQTTNVARIGNTYYTSLSAAFEAAPTDGTETVVTLLNDVEVKSAITLKNGQNVVLTDNGTVRTLTRSTEYASGKFFVISAGAQLTIKGSSGSDDNVTMILEGNGANVSTTNKASQLVSIGTSNTAAASDGAVFTLESGTALQNNNTGWGSAVVVYGTFHMNGGHIRNNTANSDNGGAIVIHTTGHMKMTGGTISGNTAKNAGGAIQMNGSNTNANGALLIEGGTITGNTAGTYGGGVRVQSKTTITGGVIKDNKASLVGAADVRSSSVNVTVGGEALIGELWVAKNKMVNIDSDLIEATDGSIMLTLEAGYTADTQVLTGDTELIANNYKKFTLPESVTYAALDSTGKLIEISTGGDGEETTQNVALIGSTYYTTLKDAFAAAPTDGTATTITLVNNVTITKDDNITLQTGQNIVLTDDGKVRTITRDAGNTGARLITIVPDSQLTIKGTGTDTNPTLIFDGNGTGGSNGQLIAVATGNAVDNGAVLTMQKGVALQNNSSNFGGAVVVYGTFNMEGGVIRRNSSSGNGGGVALHNSGVINISGGSITNNTASGNAGGIHVNRNASVVRTTSAVTMTGGAITNNTAGGYGGAITVQDKTVITGGTIANNTAAEAADGLRVSNFDLTIGGAAVIDKIWLHTTADLKIVISSPLTVAADGSILVERYQNNYAIGFQLLSGTSVPEDYKKFTLPSAVSDVAISSNGTLVEAEVTGEGLVASSAVSRAMSTNYVWAIAGAEQMSTVETINGHRNLARLIENTLRYEYANRPVRMVNASAPGYTVSYLLENYDELIGKFNPDVMMLLPEVSEVYAEDYVHSPEKVAQYKKDVIELLNKDGLKVKILITPLPSTDTRINDYINDYVEAIREIAAESPSLPFVDLNEYVSEHLSNDSAARNWFGTDMNIQPVGAIEFAKQILVDLVGQGLSLSSYQNLVENTFRESTDNRVFDTRYRTDNIEASVTLDGLYATVDISAIMEEYPELTNVRFVLLPYAGCGNYNKDIQTITGAAQSGNKYTFALPAGDAVITVYGEYNGKTYRFRDIQLEVVANADQSNIEVSYNKPAQPDGVYLNSLAVVGAPAIELVDGYSEYKVNLYQYQRTIQILAKAQNGLTIKVDGKEVVSGEYSQEIEVALGETKTVEVSVSDGTKEEVYKVTVTRPEYPDIYVTEVIANGVDYSGSEEYDVIEIYNASGKDLNLLDYSIGYKIDFIQTTSDFSKTDWPYYFTGNTQAFNGTACYTGVNQITKYSATMGKEEPTEVIFPADSTMVIWVKYTAKDNTNDTRTFQSFIDAVNANSLSITTDDGEKVKVLPTEGQIVVAELPVGETVAAPTSARAQTTYESNVHYFYLRNSRTNVQTIAAAGAFNRNWLFILADSAVADSKGQITEAGNDIISAANYTRLDDTDDGKSTIFTFDVEGGKSVIPNNDVFASDSKLHTSDEQSYNLYNTLGAIEYMQKPLELKDTEKAVVDNKTVHKTTIDKVSIDLDITDNTDIRYIELYVKASNASKYSVIRKDLVLETTANSEAGTATDVTSYSYSYSMSETELGSANAVNYYGFVYDGNGNVTAIGSEEEPLVISFEGGSGGEVPKTYVAKIGDTKYETLEEAFADVPTDGTATAITVIADIELATEIAVLAGQNVVLVNDDVTRTITRADSHVTKVVGEGTTQATANLFKVLSGASLTVKGSADSDEESAAKLIIDGNREALYAQYGSAANLYVQTVYAFAGGTFTMGKGSVLENNASSYGGAVLVQGTFNMNGGVIRNNVSYSQVGGAVALHTAGVMNMTGGTITGNTAGTNGGAVFIQGKNTVMNMSGGTISGNTAGSGTTGQGGAIYVDKSNTNPAAFVMTGGTITGNKAYKYGGGIDAFSRIEITGGTITGNSGVATAGTDGIVLHTVQHGIGGDAVVDQIWLQGGFQVDILSALTAANNGSILLTCAGGYDEGTKVLDGTADNLAASYQKFALPATVTDVVIARDGILKAAETVSDQTTPGGDDNQTTPGGDDNQTTPGGDDNQTTPGEVLTGDSIASGWYLFVLVACAVVLVALILYRRRVEEQ